ncbi:MAG: SH3 domain-containing protein [Clostridium sp.]|uniref:SH3 domain-containing protein n=1 Tax=Clostridium sp. TaxID=1506 RepID=UPI003F3D0EB6
MKNNKISMLIAASMTMATAIVAKPATASFGATIHHKEIKQKTKSLKKSDSESNKEEETGKESNLKGLQLQKVNILTGKVIKTTNEENAQELNVVFNGSNHMTYYNGKNVSPDMEQTKFHSKTQEKLYKYLMNPNNRWAAENQAIGLHDGDIYNDCVFFLSSALRNIGINIPDNIGYTTNLMNELQSLGWEKETDLSTLEAGDICFAGTAHTYVFMGWANKEEGIAWVCDNQFSWFGTNFHPRTQHSEVSEDVSPTTCYYRLPSTYTVGGNPNKVDMPINYDYKVGTVNVSDLNVRNSASLNGSIIGTVSEGTRVQILGQAGSWYKINYNGQTAYVWANYINGSAPKISKPYNITGTKESTTTNENLGTGIIDFNGNTHTAVQSGPTWNSTYLGDLENGTKVNIIGESGDWYKVQSGNNIVWVLKYRVNIQKAKKTTQTVKKVDTMNNGKVLGNGVIEFKGNTHTAIQNGPTWNSKYLGDFQNGTKVNIIGESGDWYEVQSGDTVAWVLKYRVNTILNEKILNTGVINFEGNTHTAIQNGPTWNSKYLGDFQNGTKVNIIGESGDWYEVQSGDIIAWVLKYRVTTNSNKQTQVKPSKKKSDTTTNEKINGVGIIQFSGGPFTDIQSGPTWESNFVGELTNGTKVSIVGENGDWFEITNGTGTAWVLKNRVSTSVNMKVLGTGIVDFAEGPFTDIQSGPTWESNFVGELTNGTKVSIVGETNNWFEIKNSDGVAWVLRNRINTILNGDVSGTGYINFSGGPFTDIQSGPTWESNFVGELTNGTKVSIIRESGDWYEIKNGDGTAWVLKNRVDSGIGEKVIQTGIVNFEGNTHTAIQSGPTWNSDYLGDLQNGTVVNIIGESGDWYKVKDGAGIAWVLKYRVNTKAHQVLGEGVITFAGGPYTDIQKGPAWDTGLIGTLTNGTKVTITGEQGEWYEIENGDGVAWVLKNRVNTNLNEGLNPIIKTGYIKFTGGDFTDIVSGPSWNYNFVNELNNGTKINIVAENGKWYEIQYGNGTAWVLKNRVSFEKPSGNTTYKYVNYGTSMSNYVNEEVQNYEDCFGGDLSQSQINNAEEAISNAVNPADAQTKYEFLRVDRYRAVNYEKFQQLLQGKGVFSGQAQGFINAAKEYNLDPVYLLAQSALETGWGTSNFAQGITITQIANENAPIYQNGNLVGYQMINLPNPVTVYDLFGIGADDSNGYFPNKATVLGTTYAYNHGWTSVASALKGAAQFLSANYVHNSDIAQNTPFEIRYINAPAGDIWHQYASEVNYGEEIASIIQENSDLYLDTDNFTFNIPQFS